MSNHEIILKMIEEVDHKDEKALLDINARVWAFINLSDDFKTHFDGHGSVYYRHNSWACEHQSILRHGFDMPKYTTSRDAIKSIRPDGCGINFTRSTKEPLRFWAMLNTNNPEDIVKGNFGVFKNDIWFEADSPSEELAELHATIQAIAYERQKG